MSVSQDDHALDIVRQVGEIHFEGNIIPHEWYKHILYSDTHRKPHLVAIVLLAEIVYWYRPRVEIDERSGRIIGYYKRFADTMLQRSQNSLASKFGLSRQQVRDGLDRLKELRLIRTELRDIVTSDGVPLSNVLYMEVDPVRLREISHPSDLQNRPSDLQTTPLRSTEPTYTKTTYTEKELDRYRESATPGIEHMFGEEE